MHITQTCSPHILQFSHIFSNKNVVPYPDFLRRLLFLAVYACVAKSLTELHQRSIHDERRWSAFHLMLIEQEQTTPAQNTQKQFKHIKKQLISQTWDTFGVDLWEKSV